MRYEPGCTDGFLLKNTKHITIDGADVFYADASAVDITSVRNILSEYRKNKTDKIKKESVKRLSAGAELLLIHALKVLGYDFHLPLNFVADKNGKLYFIDLKGLYFNLSHSGEMVACIICKNEAGIDIERERKINPAIADKYFTKAEKELISENLYTFTDIWVRKEAVAKADGRGIAAGLGNIDVSGDTSLLSGSEYRLYDIETSLCGYKLSVALKQTEKAV